MLSGNWGIHRNNENAGKKVNRKIILRRPVNHHRTSSRGLQYNVYGVWGRRLPSVSSYGA